LGMMRWSCCSVMDIAFSQAKKDRSMAAGDEAGTAS